MYRWYLKSWDWVRLWIGKKGAQDRALKHSNNVSQGCRVEGILAKEKENRLECVLAWAAINRPPLTSGLKQQTVIFSQFWRLEVQDQGAMRVGSW